MAPRSDTKVQRLLRTGNDEVANLRRVGGGHVGLQAIAGFRPLQLWALSQDALDIPFAVQHGDDLKRRCVGPINNGVVRIAGRRPEPKRAGCKVGAGMAAQGAFGKKGASRVLGTSARKPPLSSGVRRVAQSQKRP